MCVGGDDLADKGKFKWMNGEPVQGILWGSNHFHKSLMGLFESPSVYV